MFGFCCCGGVLLFVWFCLIFPPCCCLYILLSQQLSDFARLLWCSAFINQVSWALAEAAWGFEVVCYQGMHLAKDFLVFDIRCSCPCISEDYIVWS